MPDPELPSLGLFTPAPRYSKPVPESNLPPITVLDRLLAEARAAVQREREDRMLRIGAGLAGLAVLVAATAGRALL